MLHKSYVKPKEEYQFFVLTETLSLLTENTHYHTTSAKERYSDRNF